MRCRGAALVALAFLALSCKAPEIMSTRKADSAPQEEPDADDVQPRDGGAPDFFVINSIDAYYDVTGAGSQVFCPGQAAMQPQSCATLGVMVDPFYADKYTCYDLGPVPGVPPQKYGGLTLTLDKCSTKLLIGGEANFPAGKLYGVDVVRDDHGHVAGFSGTAKVFADAPSNDGGVAFGPKDVLFLTHWPTNELQQTKTGSTQVDKLIPLQDRGVAFASASLNFVPMGFPAADAFKMVSWSGGQFYTVAIAPDAQGTFDVMSVKQELTLPGGPEGFVYVAAGSPHFDKNSLLVSEWSANKISTYEVDDKANPSWHSPRPHHRAAGRRGGIPRSGHRRLLLLDLGPAGRPGDRGARLRAHHHPVSDRRAGARGRLPGMADDVALETLQELVDGFSLDVGRVRAALADEKTEDAAKKLLVGALSYVIDTWDMFPTTTAGWGWPTTRWCCGWPRRWPCRRGPATAGCSTWPVR
jgi:hypothetical protein